MALQWCLRTCSQMTMENAYSFSVTVLATAWLTPTLPTSVHQGTWCSPDGCARKAIDHILVSHYLHLYITNCRVNREVELANTDY